jgi:DNA-binding transcriptional ArsR family regulator
MIEEDRWITALKALADRSRLRIVQTLLDQPLTVNDLSERLGISQYNVSKHLRILREAGLVEATKLANRREYAIPSQHRGQSSEKGVLDLGSLLFRFAALPATVPQTVAA